MDETIETTVDQTTEFEANNFVEDEEGMSLGAVIVGAGAAALAVGTGVAIKNRDKIKNFFADRKKKAQIKVVNAHLDALEKLGYDVELNEKETEEE